MPSCTRMPLEVPIALLIFGFYFSDSVTTNWLMYKTCYITLHMNRSVCELLGAKVIDNSTTKLENIVQPYVTVIAMSKLLLESFFAAIACLFIGSWSDKYGRKPILLLNMGACALSFIIMTIISVIPGLSPWFILLCSIPLCFSGGVMAFIAANLCYITDITTPQNRGFRMVIFYSVITIGVLIGLMLSPLVLARFGFSTIYLIAAISNVIAWNITYFFLPESVQNPLTENKLRNLFKFSLLQDTLKVTFKPRDNMNRAIILLMVMTLALFVLSSPISSINYLYLQNKFHWTLEQYNTYNCINIIIGVVACAVAIYALNKLLGINETFVVVLGFLSCLVSSLGLATAANSWNVYAAGAAYCFNGTISPMARTLISRLVSSDDYGKVFAFLSICETIIGPLGSPMYTFVYNKTLSFAPGAYYFVTAGFNVVCLLLCTAVIILQKRRFTFTLPYVSINE